MLLKVTAVAWSSAWNRVLGWPCHLRSLCKYGKGVKKFSNTSLYFVYNTTRQVLNTGGCKILNNLLPSAAAFSYTQPNTLYLPVNRLSQERDKEAPTWLSITCNCVTLADLCITVPCVLSFACPFWLSSLLFDPHTVEMELLLNFPLDCPTAGHGVSYVSAGWPLCASAYGKRDSP